MPHAAENLPLPQPVFVDAAARAYLCVDPFLADLAGARALSSALETGVIDQLASLLQASVEDLQTALRAREPRYTPGALQLLLNMLARNGVCAQASGAWQLTSAFRQALGFRDILEAKLQMAHWMAPDFLHLFTALLIEPKVFSAQARLFKLFSYDRCFDNTPENRAHTAQWMRYTTALTRYETPALLQARDFSSHRRLLDVGGNSGEFAVQMCRALPTLQALVCDLPLVCDIGRAHVAATPQATRIGFHSVTPGDQHLPGGCDLISFKSMLHDWPDDEMVDFLRRAHAALEPGGELLVFERSGDQIEQAMVNFGQIPLMLFYRSYRKSARYVEVLRAIGFQGVSVCQLDLDMPFHLITARKPDL